MSEQDKNGDNDSLDEEQDDENREALNSVKSVEDICKTNVSKSNLQLSPKTDQEKVKSAPPTTCSIAIQELNNLEMDSDSDYTGFLEQMNVRYSQFRIASGQNVQQTGQGMDYRDYSFSEYPVGYPSCSWESSELNGQDLTSQVSLGQSQVETPSCSNQQTSQSNSFYSYERPLLENGSGSNETIVNKPSTPTFSACGNPGLVSKPNTQTAASCGNPCFSQNSNACCYPMGQPGQPIRYCYSEQGNPGQEQQLMPTPIGVDPNTGFPIYYYSSAVSYPGNGMYSMPPMQMERNQRGGGQHNMNMDSTSKAASSSSAENAIDSNVASNQNSDDMETFMKKYQKCIRDYYASAQQGVQTQQYFNNFSQGTPQYYSNPNEAGHQNFEGLNQESQQDVLGARQFFESSSQENGQSYQMGQQSFGFPLGAQQYYNNSGGQPFFPPSMGTPRSNIFGNNSGFMSDSLQTQTVYSSDYRPFSNEGNHFNHFPNGIDIGLTPEPCPIYGPAATAGLAEMGTGGQVYGMGGACEMNMPSFPLSQMSYSSPYSFEMPASMAIPQTQVGNMSGANPM
ncbi:uncharacterized protein LOC108099738 isoform X2 [Drosophila ficusphila]|uniref:uncharacterized protein LOC108099738 isoform X2 n=1 Tax=Drosophila ficusphila TaxID=30025 RepID=UPI0007E712A4|nr:uncharacterized protein LOC108099738 isoform X2 [Drosophila ficusphila]